MVDNPRPFQCEICTLTFTSKQFLKRHYVVHTDQRSYECTICSRSYKYRKGLNRHYKKYHPAFYSSRIRGPTDPMQRSPETVRIPQVRSIRNNDLPKPPRQIPRNERSQKVEEDHSLALLMENDAKIFETTPFPT